MFRYSIKSFPILFRSCVPANLGYLGKWTVFIACLVVSGTRLKWRHLKMGHKTVVVLKCKKTFKQTHNNSHVNWYQIVSILHFTGATDDEVVVTTGAIRRAKL